MRSLALSFLITIFLTLSLEAGQKKNILVLLSFHTAMPWTKQFVLGLEEFSEEHPESVEFFIEQIDSFRLEGGASEDIWVAYIKDKYKNISFDGIVVESDMATELFLNIEDRLYPDIPTIVLSNSHKTGDILIKFDLATITAKSVELAKLHNSNLEKAYIIHTDYVEGHDLEIELIKALKQENIEPIIIENYTKKSLLESIEKLPKDSALFFTIVFEDRDGEKFIPKELAEEIAKHSSVPMYVFYSSMLDSGAMGGVTQDGTKLAKMTISTLLEYIYTNSYSVATSDSLSTTINWQVMKDFGIDQKSNPADVEFINRPIPVWQEYPRETIFASIVVGLLFVIVVVLALLGLRNKKIEDMKKKMLIQSRHAAMGEMLSAIAHQWRQPLNTLYVVFQNYKMILSSSKIEDENIDRLNRKSEKLIAQMSQTIDDFRDFFKPSKEMINFKPKDVLQHSVELIEATLVKGGIDVQMDELCDGYVYGFPNDLGQCFISILQNSQDALKSKSGQKEIKIDMREKNGHMKISFYDNGGGIEPKILSKVFDPYVTTKESEGGTGIGLYMTKTIIEEYMKGSIEAKNVDDGACFVIELKIDKEQRRD